jgi:hypothetical protein
VAAGRESPDNLSRRNHLSAHENELASSRIVSELPISETELAFFSNQRVVCVLRKVAVVAYGLWQGWMNKIDTRRPVLYTRRSPLQGVRHVRRANRR